MNKLRVLYAGLVLGVLMYLWPNFVHEPLHSVAAWLQGVHVEVIYDFSHIPSQPVVEWTGQFTSMFGWQFFLLAPVCVAIVLLVSLLFTKGAWIESHVSLPIYLCIESVMNVLKYDSVISDWRILDSFTGGYYVSLLVTAVIMILTGAVVARALNIIKKKRDLEAVSLSSGECSVKGVCCVCGESHNGMAHFPAKRSLKDVFVTVLQDVDNIDKALEDRFYGR